MHENRRDLLSQTAAAALSVPRRGGGTLSWCDGSGKALSPGALLLSALGKLRLAEEQAQASQRSSDVVLVEELTAQEAESRKRRRAKADGAFVDLTMLSEDEGEAAAVARGAALRAKRAAAEAAAARCREEKAQRESRQDASRSRWG